MDKKETVICSKCNKSYVLEPIYEEVGDVENGPCVVAVGVEDCPHCGHCVTMDETEII